MSWYAALAGLLVGWGIATVSYMGHWRRYEKWKVKRLKEINRMFRTPRTALEKLESERPVRCSVGKYHYKDCDCPESPDSEDVERR